MFPTIGKRCTPNWPNGGNVLLNNPKGILELVLAIWSSCVGLASMSATEDKSPSAPSPDNPQRDSRRAQTLIEDERRNAEQQAQRIVDPDAIAVVQETKRAVEAISAGKADEAKSAIERAISKVQTLLARNPATALVPVDLEATVIDTAPQESVEILEIAQDASLAFDEQNYPDARSLLHLLMREVRVRTYNLPLATFPDALKEAARLLAEGDSSKAKAILLAASGTLAAIDQVTPIPLILAREAIEDAQAQLQNAARALEFLVIARNELRRARELGYAARAPEYASLNDEISKIEKQLRTHQDTGPGFAALKEQLASFLRLHPKQGRVENRQQEK